MSDADAKEALQVVEAKEAAEDTPVTTLEVVDSHVDRIAFDDISKCTGGFGNCLGEGGVGTVYRGNRNGDVAVKRLQNFFSEGYDFFVEVNVPRALDIGTWCRCWATRATRRSGV